MRHNFLFQIYNLIESHVAKALVSLGGHKKNYQKYLVVSSFRNSFPNIIGLFVLCLVTIYTRKYSHTLQAIEYISFFYIFVRLAQSLSEISSNISEIRLNFGAFIQVYEWFKKIERCDAVRSDGRVAELLYDDSQFGKDISLKFKNVSFGYDKSQILFENLNMQINRSDVLLVKGRSGAGKSTFVKLLTGIESPVKGEIFLNNKSLKKVDTSFRNRIGYVGPEPFIIHGTIMENLLFGSNRREKVTEAEVWDALESVSLSGEILDLKLKINEASGLSTGQKQRLSLARALLRRPEILILDEATANLDKVTETMIVDNLNKKIANMMVVIISHKPSFDRLATMSVDF